MDGVDADPRARLLTSLTGLMSRWSSRDFQTRISAACGVPLDATAVRAVYTLGLRGGSARPSEIADEVHLSRPSASKLIARLRDAGLIERDRDESDGRAGIVALTPAGRQAFDRLFDAGVQMIGHAIAQWTDDETTTFASLIEEFVGSLVTERTVADLERHSGAPEAPSSGPDSEGAAPPPSSTPRSHAG